MLGAQRMHLAALPVQVYPVRYASFAGCACSLIHRLGGSAVSSLAGAQHTCLVVPCILVSLMRNMPSSPFLGTGSFEAWVGRILHS